MMPEYAFFVPFVFGGYSARALSGVSTGGVCHECGASQQTGLRRDMEAYKNSCFSRHFFLDDLQRIVYSLPTCIFGGSRPSLENQRVLTQEFSLKRCEVLDEGGRVWRYQALDNKV